jgi:choline dehydrogenase
MTGATLPPAAHLPGPGESPAAFVRARAETLYHPVGTCRMGPGADGVVDDRLAVRETDDLWVIDGSVMPEIAAGHPHAPIAMIAERAAELLAAIRGPEAGFTEVTG